MYDFYNFSDMFRQILSVPLEGVSFLSHLKMARGGGTSFFPVKQEKFPLSYIQDAKDFSVVKPVNSGEAVASPASPVPPPLLLKLPLLTLKEVQNSRSTVKFAF